VSIGTVVDSETVSTDVESGPEAPGAAAGAPAQSDAASSEAAAPMLRVVKGDPTPEELAALVAVVAAAAGGGAGQDGGQRPLSRWGDLREALDGMPRMFSPRAFQSGRFGGL